MIKKAFTLLCFLLTCVGCYAQYNTTWVGNTFPTSADHVGNAARSMWVSPEGVVYTASLWDEKGRNIGIYQNGVTVGAMGGNSESQGSAIGGDDHYIFTAQQSKPGCVGRYSRAAKRRDMIFKVSNGTGDAIRGIAIWHDEVFISDFAGNRVAVYSTAGVQLREWNIAEPGALTIDKDGFVWVAQMSKGTLRRYTTTGIATTIIQMNASARPSALYADNQKMQLLVGDQGPDMNIKIYGNIAAKPVLQSTFGVQGGYLNQKNGIRGQTGDKRFTRIVGIGKDHAGKLYVLNNPWGGSWDLGRNGATDVHCYNPNGSLAWTLQAINFEGNAAADAGTNGTDLYSGNIIYTYSGKDGGLYKANTVDPFRYPNDPRINVNDQSRGTHFGHLASIGGNRILIAMGQNPDAFYSFYFHPATDGYIAIPGEVFTKVRRGFCLDSLGNVWTSHDKTNEIQYFSLNGFEATGKPKWGAAISTPIPASIAPLNRIEYITNGDKMILAGGSTDWTLIGNKIEVYNGWKAGNRIPNTVIALNRAQAKAITAAGDYLFVGYYAVPNIDAFNLATGRLEITFTGNDKVYVGNDTDSQYGIKAFRKSNGEYLVTKDDYNGSKVVIYHWTPVTGH